MAVSGVAFKSGKNKGMHKSAVCKGLNSSGKNKGRLKKGFKWGKSACPIPAKGESAKSTKKKSSKKRKPKQSLRTKCDGLVSSGKKKGKLKKGYKWGRFPGKCPVKAKK